MTGRRWRAVVAVGVRGGPLVAWVMEGGRESERMVGSKTGGGKSWVGNERE